MGGTIERADLGHGRGWLTPDAARSIFRIDRQIGHPQQITEAGRTYERQMQHWLTYQRDGYPIALHPDTPSIHQLGNAIDTDERHTAILNDHGWFHTVYRNGVLVEPWHYEYDITRDNHRHDHVALTKGADGVWRLEEAELNKQQASQLKMAHNYAKATFEAVAITTKSRKRSDGALTALVREIDSTQKSNFQTIKRQNSNNARRLEAQDAAIAALTKLLGQKLSIDDKTVEKAVRAEMRAWLDEHGITDDEG